MTSYIVGIGAPEDRPSTDRDPRTVSQELRLDLAPAIQLRSFPQSQEHPSRIKLCDFDRRDAQYLTSYSQPGMMQSPTGGLSQSMSHLVLSPDLNLHRDIYPAHSPFMGHQRHLSDPYFGFGNVLQSLASADSRPKPAIHISTNLQYSTSVAPSPQSAYLSAEFPSTVSSHLSSLPPTPVTPHGGTEPIMFQDRALVFDANSPMIPFQFSDTLLAGIDPMVLCGEGSTTTPARGRTSDRHRSHTHKSRPRSWDSIESDNHRRQRSTIRRAPLLGALGRKAKAHSRCQRSRSPVALTHLNNFSAEPLDEDEEEIQHSLLFESPSDVAGNVAIELPLASGGESLGNRQAVLASNRSADSFSGGLNGEGLPNQEQGTIVRSIVASDDVVNASKSRRTVAGPLFKCEVPGCGRDFTAKHNLKNHMNAHYGIKAFECKHCEKTYTTKHVLTRHLTTCKKLKYKSKKDS